MDLSFEGGFDETYMIPIDRASDWTTWEMVGLFVEELFHSLGVCTLWSILGPIRFN